MERTKENKTPLRVQGQELSRGERREQRCRPELSADGGGLHLWRECRGRQALCAGSRGCNSPGRSPEVKPLGRVQGGSACWVSRGQSPLGRVQGDNACSGVQRVKPFGPGRVDACVNPYWVLPDALRVSGAGGFAAFLQNEFGQKGGKRIEVDTAQRTFRQKRDL